MLCAEFNHEQMQQSPQDRCCRVLCFCLPPDLKAVLLLQRLYGKRFKNADFWETLAKSRDAVSARLQTSPMMSSSCPELLSSRPHWWSARVGSNVDGWHEGLSEHEALAPPGGCRTVISCCPGFVFEKAFALNRRRDSMRN